MNITLDQLRAIAPHAPESELAPLNEAMATAEITTPLRQAAFIAQLAHECCQFRIFVEVWNPAQVPAQLHYEGNVVRLGNTMPGDGHRFLGRGAVQLTGRANYARASVDLGVDLVNHPELAATPELRYRVAAWYWTKHGLNALADDGDMVGITKAIQGAAGGLAERLAFYAKALPVLGAVPVCAGDAA